MRLLDIYQINHKDFSISIGVIYSLSWTDNRLVTLGNKSFINMDVDFIKTLWVGFTAICSVIYSPTTIHQVPDLYIYDLKTYKNRETIRPQVGVSLKKHSGNLGKYQD